jgi:hypothetical protein
MNCKNQVRFGGVFKFKCLDSEGNVKWEDENHNLVVNAGLQHILDVTFSGGTAVDPWYIGLTDNSPTINSTDTLGGHGSWTEFTEYSSNRKAYVETRTNQQLSNSGDVATFSISSSGGGVGGGFLCSASTGTSGTLMGGAALSGGNRTVADGDTVEVTYTFSAADDGA